MSQQKNYIMEAIGNAEKAVAAAGSITGFPEFQQQLDQVRTAGEKILGIGTQTRQTLDNLQAGLAKPPKFELSPETKASMAAVRDTVASVTV